MRGTAEKNRNRKERNDLVCLDCYGFLLDEICRFSFAVPINDGLYRIFMFKRQPEGGSAFLKQIEYSDEISGIYRWSV